MRNPLDPRARSGAYAVQEELGTAYDTVKLVADNITDVNTVAVAIPTILTDILDNRDSALEQVTTEGDTQDARLITEGDTQIARVITEGDTQDARITAAGTGALNDIDTNRVASLLALDTSKAGALSEIEVAKDAAVTSLEDVASTYMLGVLDSADEGAAQTALGVKVGVDVHPFDDMLTSLTALNWAAGLMVPVLIGPKAFDMKSVGAASDQDILNRFAADIRYNKRSEFEISVESYSPSGVITDDDTTPVRDAVAAALALGATLYFPKVYNTTGSIDNFHACRKRGPGGVKRNSQTFYIQPKAGQENIVWFGAAGADTNDGLSSNFPLREPKAASSLLANYDDASGAAWTLQDLTGGTYKGGVLIPRGFGKRNFVKIKGATAAHPTPSTTIIDKAADATATYGISASDGTLLWLENVTVNGAFSQGIYVNKNVYLQLRNTHIDGAVCGLQLNVHCRYFVTGGKIRNCSNYGINELFNITRSFDTVSAVADGMIIELCGKTGIKAKENCNGHMDFLTIQDCPVAVELQMWSGANVGNLTLKRNQLGFMLMNSELHEYTSVLWGAGADASTRRVKRRGLSSVIEMYGWVPDGGLTVQYGQTPPIKIRDTFTTVTVTGTTTETDVASWANILLADLYAVKGARYYLEAKGRLGASAALAANARVLMRVGGTFMTDVTIPSGAPANAFWKARWDVVCTADGAFQLVSSELLVEGASGAMLGDMTMIARTVDMSSTDRGIILSVILGNSADNIAVWSVELFG